MMNFKKSDFTALMNQVKFTYMGRNFRTKNQRALAFVILGVKKWDVRYTHFVQNNLGDCLLVFTVNKTFSCF